MSLSNSHPPASEPPLGPLINELSRLMGRAFDQRLRAAGFHLTRAQWQILYHIAGVGTPTQSEIAEALELERMTICRHAARLEAEGWLEQRPDKTDGRIARLHLRPKTKAALARLQPVIGQLRRDYFAGLPRTGRQKLFTDLSKIRDNLVAMGITPPSFS